MWTTVGDIERDLLALYPAAATAGSCGSAMAFRRLRASLPSVACRARPGTSLDSLAPGSASRRMVAHFRREELFVPASQGGAAATLGILALLVGCLMLAPLAVLDHSWAGLALMAAGAALVALDRGTPCRTTLGELARDTAAMNFAVFADRGADRRRTAIFDAVRRIVGSRTRGGTSRIDRKTRLFD